MTSLTKWVPLFPMCSEWMVQTVDAFRFFRKLGFRYWQYQRMLLEVMNEDTITGDTRKIEVRIRAEKGFDPQREVDVKSLRFGSFTEVNFGRGCKAVGSRKEGKDLVVVFDGKGNGMGADEFAPKMLGRDKDGGLLYGYASLPYVDYTPAILSAAYPMYDRVRGMISLEVKNYGLSESRPAQVVVEAGGRLLAEGQIGRLQPYEEQVACFDVKFKPALEDLSEVTVSSVLFWETPSVILLTPRASMELVTEVLMEFPTLMIAITEAIPIIIPSMVRSARILFARRPLKARSIFSPISIRHCPSFLR